MSNIGNVLGGHKANLSNPNTSEESKQHSLEVIEKELSTESSSGVGATAHNDNGKDPVRVYDKPFPYIHFILLMLHSTAGLKAALHNPNVSDEAKENVSHHLADITSTSDADDGKDPTRVAAGLKAALHNNSVSDEAKEHVKERLVNMK
ncbi:hypothetical protein E4T39_00850 [Aureobasidium subglaciale]|nr:hypothetical protein E4T39_00850 [Aureobasidium subglaciale]